MTSLAFNNPVAGLSFPTWATIKVVVVLIPRYPMAAAMAFDSELANICWPSF